MPRKQDALAAYITTMAPATDTAVVKDQKVVEYYMSMLAKHQTELGKAKLTVWMQVGSFFEVYGLKYPNGMLVGNVWDVAQDLDIKVAAKDQTVYGSPDIEVYMAGVKEEYADYYLERLVDRQGWTVAVYTQDKVGTRFERVLRQIISPGLNFETDALSNNFMYLYFKSEATGRFNLLGRSAIGLRIGLYFVDCISGENGALELYSKDINEYGVVFSELVKLITIKNPAEVIVHLDVVDLASYSQFSEQNIFCNLGLFDKAVRYIKTSPDQSFTSPDKQQLLLEKAYSAHKGRQTIFQQLCVDSQFDYGRLAM
jgi:DNA mismatch repair ATPase MutS